MRKFSEILENLDTMIDGLSPLKDVQMENIELLADQAAKRAMMSALLDPREAVPWKWRKVIPMHQTFDRRGALSCAARPACEHRQPRARHSYWAPRPSCSGTHDGHCDGL